MQQEVLSHCPSQLCNPNHISLSSEPFPQAWLGWDAAGEWGYDQFCFFFIQVVGKGEQTGSRQGSGVLCLFSSFLGQVIQKDGRKSSVSHPLLGKRRKVLWVRFPPHKAWFRVAERMGKKLCLRRSERDRYTVGSPLPATHTQNYSP